MSSAPAPIAGASVQPGTHQVMVWLYPVGQLAHLIPLPPGTARELAAQLNAAADLAERLSRGEGEK
ncbi:hypothetical protein [Nocardiopsis metallicus]|uniref:Uncharacterized protein n=1 Tax=Nocardiopsis metallicus TaxID=179819 RepID=A0A840WPA4_9ACTN|nr:hypothetical protein [Nocardiopsis metallicus]MBB5493437.1 hypothetical protein [Nocardiopsis metallicus]